MRAFSLVFLLAFLVLFIGDLSAQVNRGISAAGRRMDDFDNQRTKAERDAMNREMSGRKPTKEELRNAARIKAETREDLEGLQQSYNEIVTHLSGGATPEISFVAEATAKVNKHANRLKANIVFPAPAKEDERKPVGITGDTRKHLRDLCTRIYEFLTNPMIENPNVLDLEAANSARSLLDAIITLSDRAAKS